MAFADNMIALEARLLARFGANGVLSGPSTAFDADTGRMVAVPVTSRTVRMTVGDAETLDEEGREVFRTVAKMQVEPVRGGTILFAGTTYTIGNVRRLYEADKVVLYVAEVNS